jgi:hypothetical protein
VRAAAAATVGESATSGGPARGARAETPAKRRKRRPSSGGRYPADLVAQEQPMHLKVQNGTASNCESSLCNTCRLSTIVRGRALDEEIVHCHALSTQSMRITFKVTHCSAYSDARRPSYLQMMEHAWILRPGSKKRPAGFIRSADLRQDELAEIMVDIHNRS